MAYVDIPREVDMLTGPNNSEPMENEAHEDNLARRPPLGPRILNQADNISQDNASKRTTSKPRATPVVQATPVVNLEGKLPTV